MNYLCFYYNSDFLHSIGILNSDDEFFYYRFFGDKNKSSNLYSLANLSSLIKESMSGDELCVYGNHFFKEIDFGRIEKDFSKIKFFDLKTAFHYFDSSLTNLCLDDAARAFNEKVSKEYDSISIELTCLIMKKVHNELVDILEINNATKFFNEIEMRCFYLLNMSSIYGVSVDTNKIYSIIS